MRDTPPHIAQYPFEIVSQRGVSRAFCLVFKGYRTSIAEIPLLWGGGGIAPPLRNLTKGEMVRRALVHGWLFPDVGPLVSDDDGDLKVSAVVFYFPRP